MKIRPRDNFSHIYTCTRFIEIFGVFLSIMEIQDSSLPGFYCSRVLGLAPYLFRRNNKDRIDDIRRSKWLCVYSICFIVLTVSMTVRFIFVDSNSKTPIRMRTATSKFVTVFDVCVVVGACLTGAATGVFANKFIQKINTNLNKADDELVIFNEQRRDKRRNLIMIAVVFVTMTGMIILDIVSKYRSFAKFKEDLRKQNKPIEDIHIIAYFPFYFEYYVLMALHVQFAQTALGVQRRYYRLNLAIRNIFALKKLAETASNMKKNRHAKEVAMASKAAGATTTATAATAPTGAVTIIDSNNEVSLPGSNINTSANSIAKATTLSHAIQEDNHVAPTFTGKYSASLSTAYGKLATTTTLTRASFFLDRLAYTHAILGDTVTLISKAFGITLLVMLASCLLHLVATSYFLFIELLGDPYLFVASLQMLWCCFHLSRLLLIVEPCHMATTEARKTIIIVCEVLRNCKDISVEPVLQQFWRQLLADRTYNFTACGMCIIDRQILTSLSATLATYLVILIQFQKTDG